MPYATMNTGPNENGGGSVTMVFKKKAWFCKASIIVGHPYLLAVGQAWLIQEEL